MAVTLSHRPATLPSGVPQAWLQVSLGCVQLSLSCPFRRLHTFRFLRPARLLTPLLGYGAPHLSARGTSTLLNNALLSAHFRVADQPERGTLWSPLRNRAVKSCRGQAHDTEGVGIVDVQAVEMAAGVAP